MNKSRIIIISLIFIGFISGLTAQTVYITKTGEKYHTATCRYLKYSKIEIELEKALELGYEPCLVCKPAQNTKDDTSSNITSSSRKTPSAGSKRSTAVQCTGKTKSGVRCKRKTTNSNGRCYQH
ncbi:hypothetical protein [Abyssalbus ytuae]|uniref:Uncharacterized protein n=1 Tax=Abyssalbus ytuae TaxID=2926907 RepID=A0A9E6ZNS7_9FLAO|nr:hypothetical protein [Abyssalbus ytuae]UOB19349.1 hypothetical protein MQE35_08630 [Abyssalbus ytuae]